MLASLASKFWNLAVSPVVFVVLACLWCADLGIGSILAYQRDPKFWMKMDSVPFNVWLHQFAPREMPHSLWVYVLVVLTWLVAFSLLLCTIGWFYHRRARKRTLAEALLHFGFMLVFTGFVVGSGWGDRVQNVVARAGETVDVAPLGVKLKLNGVKVVRDDSGRELETVSTLDLLDSSGGLLASGQSRINHPLIHGETVIYPQGGEEKTIGADVAVQGFGEVRLAMDENKRMPDGRELRVRGVLEAGQTYGRWVGPGAFITVGYPNGPDLAGAFVGEGPLFRDSRLGNIELGWRAPVRMVVAAFNVHRDPGVRLVLPGALILTLGTFWALGAYLKRGG